MDKQIIHDFRIGKVNKDNDKEYRCDKLIELNKYKFYLVDTDVSYSYSIDANIHDNVIYLCKNYYYYYKNAELAGYDITFTMNRNTFKSIMKDINSNYDFTKKCYAITFGINDRKFFFLRGNFEISDDPNKENILINYVVNETIHEFEKGSKVKNKFVKSAVEGVSLSEKYKNKNITRIFTPDDFDETEDEVQNEGI